MRSLTTHQRSSPTSVTHVLPEVNAADSAASFTDWALRLQGAIGNRAVGRLLAGPGVGSPSIQRTESQAAPALMVGPPSDAFEHEADRVADAVMATPGGDHPARPTRAAGDSPVQRKCASCERELPAQDGSAGIPIRRKCAACEDESKTVQRQPGGAVAGPASAVAPPVASRIDGLKAGGQPLPAEERGFFEPRLGADLGHVRVHQGAGADEAARALRAHAFTTGRHVVFASGQYAPGTVAGRKLIAHELAHVLQQRGGVEGPIRRKPDQEPGVHSGGIMGMAGPSGVPLEKWSQQIEAQFRKRGDAERADAIRACRTSGGGACTVLLTQSEMQSLYAAGKEAGGDPDKAREVLAGLGPGLGLASQASKVNPAVVRGALAALRTVPAVVAEAAPVVVAEAAPVVAPAAAPAGLALGSLAGPAALLVIVVATGYLLWKLGQFQAELRKNGFKILDDPLATCITGCHVSSNVTRSLLDEAKSGDLKIDPSWFPPQAAKPKTVTVTPAEPVMPTGLSAAKQKKWQECKEMHDDYKSAEAANASLAAQVKKLLEAINNNPKDAAARHQLCILLDQLIDLLKDSTKIRQKYVDKGCDEFDWFKRGTTEAERRQAHVDHLAQVDRQIKGLYKDRKQWCGK